MRKSNIILVSVSFVAAFALLGVLPPDACCQDSSTSNDGGVVVRKNADGSVDTFDATDPAASGSGATPQSQGGGGEIRYGVHGEGKPYTKKHGDGVVVRRNADGTIETYDTSETTEYFPLAGAGSTKPAKKKRPVKRKRSSTTRTTSKTAAKKPAPKKK
ncbi:hypothetical protein GC174_02930 [bacterium]|nr:hypothetical protein [bacterium]